ncbi:hypothetical protein TL16_g05013 [Triparma laevis f. inornata]|uniref:Uncharacterized protein n=2 Tax=Triparma laevis TaxID=1534972 RepID=A0A9W7EBM2_9STRA|nr:hypothetical protein TL16_g05013 [Triparma laevis f. inornata]GMH72992.1 hypothetical protein TrLO_g14113 [Triparma laevis f. longispina]
MMKLAKSAKQEGVKLAKESRGKGTKIMQEGVSVGKAKMKEGRRVGESMAAENMSRVKGGLRGVLGEVAPQVGFVKQAAVTATKKVAPEMKRIVGQGAKEASDSASSYVWGKAGKWFFIWSLSAVFVFAVGSSIPRAVLTTIIETQRTKDKKEEGDEE